MANRALVSGSETRPVLANAQMLGGLSLNQSGSFVSLTVSGSDNADKSVSFASKSGVLLSASFADVSGSVIQALNFLKAKVDTATGIGGSGTDNQVAVFSAAQAIDSSANLTFDGSAFAVGGTTTTLSGSSTMSLTPDGDFNLDSSAAVSINSDNASTAISIGDDNIAGAVNVGTGGARTVSLGSSAATEVQVDAIRVDLNAGSNGLQVDSTGATTVSGSNTGAFSYQGAVTLDSSAAVSINSDSAAISIGDDAIAGAINLGTAGARTVSLGSAAATEVQVDAVRVDLNAGSNGLQVDSVGATTVSGSSTGAFSYQNGLTLDSSGAVAINSDSAAISIGGDAVGGAINVGTAGGRAISIGSTGATSLDMDAEGAVSLDSTAGSVTVGGILADGQSLGLGKNGRAQIVVSPNAASAGSENIAITNTGGTNTIAAGAGAIDLHADAGGVSVRGDADSNMAVYLGASQGGVYVGINPSGDYGEDAFEGFNVASAASGATYAFINDKGATFPVARSAGYAVNASGTLAVGGTDLALGADTRFLAMSAFPTIGMLGVSESGALRQYYLQVSGGILQVQQGS